MQSLSKETSSGLENSQPVYEGPMRIKSIGYWATTGLSAFILLSGGWWLLTNTLAVNQNLGLPPYIWQILAFWKILGGIAILAPRFPLTKEWAYAGIFFNMTGASAVRIFVGDSSAHIIAPLIICAIAMASWALRPDSRKIHTAR